MAQHISYVWNLSSSVFLCWQRLNYSSIALFYIRAAVLIAKLLVLFFWCCFIISKLSYCVKQICAIGQGHAMKGTCLVMWYASSDMGLQECYEMFIDSFNTKRSSLNKVNVIIGVSFKKEFSCSFCFILFSCPLKILFHSPSSLCLEFLILALLCVGCNNFEVFLI